MIFVYSFQELIFFGRCALSTRLAATLLTHVRSDGSRAPFLPPQTLLLATFITLRMQETTVLLMFFKWLFLQ